MTVSETSRWAWWFELYSRSWGQAHCSLCVFLNTMKSDFSSSEPNFLSQISNKTWYIRDLKECSEIIQNVCGICLYMFVCNVSTTGVVAYVGISVSSGIWIFKCSLCRFKHLLCCVSDPEWASYTLGMFICHSCSGLHRNIAHISKVKSILLDPWSSNEVEVCTFVLCTMPFVYVEERNCSDSLS